MSEMASKYALAVLNRRPADNQSAWLDWAREDLYEFYRYAEHGEFRSSDGHEIRYALFENKVLPEEANTSSVSDPLNDPTDQFVASLAQAKEEPAEPHRGWVVIAPGRIESYLKYQEITLELVAAGYSVAMIDHRGQGHSSRLTHHHQHGHVNNFTDYVRDFAEWMQLIEPRIGDAPAYILSHSMGGAIAAQYLQQFAGSSEFPFNPFKKIVFCAPMFGIQTRPFPFWIAKPLTRFLAFLNSILAPKKPWYAPTTGDYIMLPFAENLLTHSESRYSWFSNMYHDMENIKVGGPTNYWVAEAILAARQVVLQAERLKIPALVLQGAEDKIVAPKPQQEFIERQKNSASKLKRIEGARHEILMENDAIREPAMKQILQFLRAK
ncbi:lysophospholipase [Aliidiomarina iranensis]|uniref:Lysophospholipase n=1 Tax=Aliidiomarina iranensis TaxID=1434071 RepID=A0A432VWV7_9GAMM|nr:alpha/beta fold hydrolase [Aliidiomarina iranensis]RUO20941.1 lysophospholipase [Aliidiomarina iranensis]